MGKQNRNHLSPGLGSEALNWSNSGSTVKGAATPIPYVQEVDSIKGHITAPPEPWALQRGWMHQGITFLLSETQPCLERKTKDMQWAMRGFPDWKEEK